MDNFTEQTVIVTGGTRGIGRGIAEAFLEGGARVIVSYCSDERSAREFQEANQQDASRIDLRKFDVSDFSQVEDFFKDINDRYSSLEVLVNNSGIRRDAVLGMMKPKDWNRVLEVNLTGVFNMSKFAVLSMLGNRYGRIINITSPSGKTGFAGQTNYAAAKAGLVGFTRSLSKEVARRGITANCISPGFINTGFIDDLPEKLKKSYLDSIPVKRFGTPGEVAAGALFLASREAAYVTGTVLEVTGGL